MILQATNLFCKVSCVLDNKMLSLYIFVNYWQQQNNLGFYDKSMFWSHVGALKMTIKNNKSINLYQMHLLKL